MTSLRASLTPVSLFEEKFYGKFSFPAALGIAAAAAHHPRVSPALNVNTSAG